MFMSCPAIKLCFGCGVGCIQLRSLLGAVDGRIVVVVVVVAEVESVATASHSTLLYSTMKSHVLQYTFYLAKLNKQTKTNETNQPIKY